MPRRQLPVPQVLQLPLGVLWAVVDATGEAARQVPGYVVRVPLAGITGMWRLSQRMHARDDAGSTNGAPDVPVMPATQAAQRPAPASSPGSAQPEPQPAQQPTVRPPLAAVPDLGDSGAGDGAESADGADATPGVDAGSDDGAATEVGAEAPDGEVGAEAPDGEVGAEAPDGEVGDAAPVAEAEVPVAEAEVPVDDAAAPSAAETDSEATDSDAPDSEATDVEAAEAAEAAEGTEAAAPPSAPPADVAEVGKPVDLSAEVLAPEVPSGAELPHDELPLPDYDHMTLGSLRGRLRSLDLVSLVQIRDYERAHANRLPIVSMLENRIVKITAAAPVPVPPEDGSQL